MKELRGGLPENYSNKGFCWSFIGLFIVCAFFVILLCREGTGICETVIEIGFMYLVVLYIYFIFSGTVGCECTEETYALVKSWLPESVRMPKVKF